MVDSFGEKTCRDCDFQCLLTHDAIYIKSNKLVGEVCGGKNSKIWKEARATELFKN